MLRLLFAACAVLSALHLAAQPNLVRAEYFINQDPGPGLGTVISIPASNHVQDIGFTVNTATLPTGIHYLYLRIQDANGVWSHAAQWIFARPFAGVPVLPAQAGPVNIVQAEYFINNDPGIGAGIPIPVGAGLQLQDISFTFNSAPLPTGIHYLYVRTKDANGVWSHAAQWVFARPFGGAAILPAQPGAVALLRAEYFIDNDPGPGLGTPVAIPPTSLQLDNWLMDVNTAGLSTGNHRLYLRVQDANGVWSHAGKWDFGITAVAAAPAITTNSVVNRSQFCAFDSVYVSFDASGNFAPNNQFQVQLSDAAGNFATPTTIGSMVASGSRIIGCRLPSQLSDGNGYKIRVVSTQPAVTGTSNNQSLQIRNRPLFADTLLPIVCQGSTRSLLVFNTAGLAVQWSTTTPGNVGAGAYNFIATNSFGCKDTALITVAQEVAIWQGTVSSDWHNAANWNISRVPAAHTHVIVPSGTPFGCNLSSANGQAASVQVRSGASIQLANGRQVLILARCQPLPAGQ